MHVHLFLQQTTIMGMLLSQEHRLAAIEHVGSVVSVPVWTMVVKEEMKALMKRFVTVHQCLVLQSPCMYSTGISTG